MGYIRRILSVACLAASILAMPFAHPSNAQGQSGTDASTRLKQQQLFEQLQQKPDDLDAMFAYAVLSIELKDYEQAIATLERMLIYRSDLARVKLELGSAYFRLGSYEVARFYFNEALDGDLTPDLRTRAEEFLVAIEERTKKSNFAAVASFGVVYSTNANLGPAERGIDVFGLNAQLDPAFLKQDDIGFRASVSVLHTLDLQRPNDDAWITEAAFTSLHYLEQSDGDVDAFIVKTGPRLALTDESFGPKVRPFIDGSVISSGNELLYVSGGGGVELEGAVDETSAWFSRLGARYREFSSDRNESDGPTVYGEAGMQHKLAARTVLRGSAFGVFEDAAADFAKNYQFGGRLSLAHDYQPEWSLAGQQFWTVAAIGQIAGRWYDAPDPAVDPSTTRRDLDIRIGLSHAFRFSDGWSASLEASYFDRSSNIRNFRLDNFEVGAFVSKRF